MSKITVSKTAGEWLINIDNINYSLKKAAAHLGISYGALARKISKNKSGYDKLSIDIQEWVDDYLWKKKYGVSYVAKVYTNPEGCKTAVSLVVEITGRNKACILEYIRKWANGIIDTDQLYWPQGVPFPKKCSKGNESSGGNKEWRSLGKENSEKNKLRDELNNKIPEPTCLEKRTFKNGKVQGSPAIFKDWSTTLQHDAGCGLNTGMGVHHG